MAYSDDHTDDECDKCLKKVGRENLKPLNWLYLDMNDKKHPDMGRGYRQYWCCEDCYDKA